MFCPAAISVKNQANMLGQILPIQLALETRGVKTIEEAQSRNQASTRHTTTLVLRTALWRPSTKAAPRVSKRRSLGKVTNQAPRDESTETSEDDGTLSLPLLEESIEYHQLDPKPSWRGWIHAGTFPFALAAGIVLIALARGVEASVASAVFVVSSLTLFGVSAVYHRFNWSAQTKAVLRRLDHANIFLLIAGTYTPIALLALPPDQGNVLLWLVWGGTALGIVLRVFWLNSPRWLYVPLYLLLGWAAVMYVPELLAANVAMMVLVIVGGGLYTVGAVVYGTKWPNPSPKNFGFHEIFHSFTVLAFLCHWTAVLLIAMNPVA